MRRGLCLLIYHSSVVEVNTRVVAMMIVLIMDGLFQQCYDGGKTGRRTEIKCKDEVVVGKRRRSEREERSTQRLAPVTRNELKHVVFSHIHGN